MSPDEFDASKDRMVRMLPQVREVGPQVDTILASAAWSADKRGLDEELDAPSDDYYAAATEARWLYDFAWLTATPVEELSVENKAMVSREAADR